MNNKQELFNKLMEQMLSDYESNKGKDASEIVADSLNKLGVSEEAKEKAAKAGILIDKIQEKSIELEEAKKNGGRDRWLSQQIYKIVDGKPEEDQKAILEAFEKTANIKFEEELQNN